MEKRTQSKLTSHFRSYSPSRSHPTSRSSSKSLTSRSEVEKSPPKSPSTFPKTPSSDYNLESPKVQTLINKLGEIYVSAENPMSSKAFDRSVTSILQPTQIITRFQNKKLGVPPFWFPLPCFWKKTKKSKSQTSTSEILSNFPPQTPSFPPFIHVNPSSQSTSSHSSSTNTQLAYSSTQSPSISTSSQTPLMVGSQQQQQQQKPPSPVKPWANP